MNNNLTHIAFILDRSRSMASMAEEAIGGFNAFIADQQEAYGWEFLFLGADLQSVDYAREMGVPRQNSMRYDSVGESMHHSHQFISERRRRKKVQN